MIIKKIYNSLDLQKPPIYRVVMWIIWYIYSFVLFEFMLVSKPLVAGNTTNLEYLLGIVPLSLFLQDSNYLMSLEKYKSKLGAYIYRYNIILMLIGIVLVGSLYNNFGLDMLVRESVAFTYWILSIPLTIIHNTKWWIVGAISIAVNSFLYLNFLEEVANLVDGISLIYMVCTIGVCIFAFLISVIVFRFRIKQIFCK